MKLGGGRGVYSIGAVARMLGIPAATIRNWEERYATIVPERSAGGHRLYSRDQVEQLRFIAAEVSRGLSAADAHRLLAEQGEGGQPSATDGRSAGTRLLVLLAERDPVAAELAQFFLRTEGYEVHLALAVGEAEEQWLESRPAARDRGADDLRRSGRGAVPAAEAARSRGRARHLRPAGSRRGAGRGRRRLPAEAARSARARLNRQGPARSERAGRSPRTGSA